MPRSKFTVKDSGAREEYASGMRRDTQEGKPLFDLCWPDGVPFDEQMLTRFAMHMTNGAVKYGKRNWEKADSADEYNRFRGSALRHMAQWYMGMRDEDHAAAVFFNLMAAESLRWKMAKKKRKKKKKGKKK